MNILAMIFGWLNDQLLKMRWLSELVRLLVEKVFGLPVSESYIIITINICHILYPELFSAREDKEDSRKDKRH